MSKGTSPEDFVPDNLRTELNDAFGKIPEAAKLFHEGRVVQAEELLRQKGYSRLAFSVDQCMPYMYSP